MHDLAHPADHFDVLFPLPHQVALHVLLGLGVDDIKANGLGLSETLHPMDSLDELIELMADPEEDRPVAEPLQVRAGSEHLRLGRDLLDLTIGKRDDCSFSVVKVLAAIDRTYAWDG